MSGQIPVSQRTRSALLRAVRGFMVETEGAALVEFTLFAPMLLVMVVGTMDLGLGVYRKMQVEDAAQAGVQYAMQNGFPSTCPPSSCTSSPSTCPLSTAVTGATTYGGITACPVPAWSCGCPTSTGVTSPVTSTACSAATYGACNTACTCSSGAQAGTYVTVYAKATYTTLARYPLFPNSFNLTAQSTVRTQ